LVNTVGNIHSKPAGYAELIGRYNLVVLPNWHESAVAAGNIHRIEVVNNRTQEVFPSRYWPGDSLGDHLEFALKYDGTNLGILASIFKAASQDELVSYVDAKPTGKYARRIWYLYELFTDKRLPLPNLRQGNYINLLDPDEYYTSGKRAAGRQRVWDNLMGDSRFCPLVRRTDRLKAFEQARLDERCRRVMAHYPDDLLKRALQYLYTKETKSSFEIEHLAPSPSRTERFVALLHTAEKEDFVNKDALIAVQNRIVDERFRDHDYRRTQNYVGETVALHQERVHCVFPKPGDLPAMMDGLVVAHKQMGDAGMHPVVHAATVAFGFVFLHPFEDGNGRIHRFLIHNILAQRGFTPKGIMFPVSAAMLRNPIAYDAALEEFSKPRMLLVEYSLDEKGQMTVQNDTAALYQYIDVTTQAEALFQFVQDTVDKELVEELDFLRNYDEAKRAIQEIADVPDRMIDLFIRCCLQNNGRLSNRKRSSEFGQLTDSEVEQMEAIVQKAYRAEGKE
jgi:hypothetical protein